MNGNTAPGAVSQASDRPIYDQTKRLAARIRALDPTSREIVADLARLRTVKRVADARGEHLSRMIVIVDGVLAKLGLLRTTEGTFLEVQEQRGELVRAYEFLEREPNFTPPPVAPQAPKAAPIATYAERPQKRPYTRKEHKSPAQPPEALSILAQRIWGLKGSLAAVIRQLAFSDSPVDIGRATKLATGTVAVVLSRGYGLLGLSRKERPDLTPRARRELIRAALRELGAAPILSADNASSALSERVVVMTENDLGALLAKGYRLVPIENASEQKPTHRLYKD
jgi:hypothetical protein